jgi:hypothetical protein
MSISRRTALIGAGLLLSRQVRAAEDKDEQRALFWTVTPPGRKGGVLFGYERIAAAITPEIVRDGEALAGASQDRHRHAAAGSLSTAQPRGR